MEQIKNGKHKWWGFTRIINRSDKAYKNLTHIAWNIYVPDASYLTQRGATILLDENDNVLYQFIPDSLLGYSRKMSTPLSFLNDFINQPISNEK